jgi:hypothetical protein
MARITTVLALLMAWTCIAGCAREWSKPGTTEQELNGDKLSCEQDAVKLYPVIREPPLTYRPPASSKLDPNCVQQTGFDSCNTAGQSGPPTDTRGDTNAYNRDAAVKACLISKGYTYTKASR